MVTNGYFVVMLLICAVVKVVDVVTVAVTLKSPVNVTFVTIENDMRNATRSITIVYVGIVSVSVFYWYGSDK
jgi:hypothetical protein